jgi:glycerophosphoryl diester phosphodiesterase
MTDGANIRFPKVFGHRGAAGHAPENTLGGFRKAAALGASWVEFDVTLTREGEPVLLHDDTVNRTTNGKGKIAELTLRELRSLDAGSWFSKAYSGESVPTLGETIELLESLGLIANIEIKPTAGREIETGQVVAKRTAALWPNTLRAPLFSSFSTAALAAAQETAPAIPRGLLLGRVTKDWRDLAQRLDCLSVHCNHRRLDRRGAEQIRGSGYHLLAYTVNDAERALKLFEWGVESVFSDYPDRILAI